LLWVGLGGALGALCRYTWSAAFVAGERFPWATLTINIAGSFLIGLAWGAWSQEGWFNTWGRAFLVTGVLGGFTTFSAFSLETIALAEAGRVVTALITSSQWATSSDGASGSAGAEVVETGGSGRVRRVAAFRTFTRVFPISFI
jgi:CrcB protein